PITLTLNAVPAVVKVYDETNAAELVDGNYALANVLEGDDVRVSGVATYKQVAVGADLEVTATDFVLSGADAANYRLTTSEATTTGSIIPGAADAGRTTFEVSAAVAGEQVTVTITARDAFGNVVTDLGSQAFSVTVSGANSAAMAVENNHDGTYTAVYTPDRAGMDQMAGLLNDILMAGSPHSYSLAGPPSMPIDLCAATANKQVTLS